MASVTATQQASPGPGPKHNIEAIREEYYERIAKHDMTPLWKVMSSVVTKEPVTHCVPVIWQFGDIKRLVMESGGLITAEDRKSTRLNSSHLVISYAVFCLKTKKINHISHSI